MKIFKFQKQKLGEGFSDFLQRESQPSPRKNQEERGGLNIAFIYIFVIIAFFVLAGRLFHLTVVKGAYYRDLAENNRIREEKIKAPRGVIYDRNGIVLARNTPIYKKCSAENKFDCKMVKREKALELEAKGELLRLDLGREYPEASFSAHAVGYMKEISKEELEANQCQDCYLPGDFVGATGGEEAFENILSGVDGRRLVEVDSSEKELQELYRIEPREGENVYLSIDINLQKKAAEVLQGKKGVIIVSNPATGEILALYSSPSFDPNLFAEQSEKLADLLADENQPLFNRAISGTYPPGSTFKIVTAAAGLEERAVTENTLIEDTGRITIGEFSFANWYFTRYGRTEGDIGIVRAIARSNDIFFYKLGEWVGEEKLIAWAKKFKLGTKLGVELEEEAAGIVRRDRKLYLGDIYHLAIGQGDLSVTPLQVNSWTSTIANGGKMCRPTILKTQNSKLPPERRAGKTQNEGCADLNLSRKTVELITEGMKQACSPGGTAGPLFKFQISNFKFQIDNKNFFEGENGQIQIPIACKTGTAEFGDPEDRTHAWLTAFAPAADPEAAVTVLIEAGGEGSSAAGPVAKEILKKYFQEEMEADD